MKKEVKQALIKEAEKRGFKKGVRYNAEYLGYDGQDKLLITSNDFKLTYNTLLIDNYEIFKNGIWAEIIETITKEEAEKQLGKTII